MLIRPGLDGGEIRDEGVRNDVLGVTNEDGSIPLPREALDVLDHLRVVISGEEGFVSATVGHGQPADKVRQPDVGGPFLLGVFVQVVVKLPGFITDPQVVLLPVHDIMEEHVVRDEDLVHAPPRLEAVEAILGGFALAGAALLLPAGPPCGYTPPPPLSPPPALHALHPT